jgi:hypothetical protein
MGKPDKYNPFYCDIPTYGEMSRSPLKGLKRHMPGLYEEHIAGMFFGYERVEGGWDLYRSRGRRRVGKFRDLLQARRRAVVCARWMAIGTPAGSSINV